jgi:hypothetical protein
MYKAINGFTKSEIVQTLKDNWSGLSFDRSTQSCLYRGPAGAMCGVGCFIPDELYNKNMENKSVTELLNDHKNLEPSMPLPLGALLIIQSIHDASVEMEKSDDVTLADMVEWIENNVED